LPRAVYAISLRFLMLRALPYDIYAASLFMPRHAMPPLLLFTLLP